MSMNHLKGSTIRLAKRLGGIPRSTVIWRSTIITGYVALAIVIGIADGPRGLAILAFFYLLAAAWVVFFLVWGWAARSAGRWNFERVDRGPPRRERKGSRRGDGEATPCEHHEVVVDRDSPPAPDAKQRKPVPVL